MLRNRLPPFPPLVPSSVIESYEMWRLAFFRVVASKIQRTSIVQDTIGVPEKLRSDFMGRGRMTATSTSQASSLLQVHSDEVAMDFGERGEQSE